MSTALAVPQSQQLAGWESKIDLITRTVAKGATPDELQLFLHQCRKTGLDPLAKQIYFQKRKDKNGNYQMVIITGIDGYRLIADRTGAYAGNDDPEFDDPENQPTWAKVTVYKMVQGQRCPFTATARWSQYFPGDYLGFMWKRMPHLMLGKCAEALALRKAFPAELSGVYTAEEMHQAGPSENDEAPVQHEELPPPKRICQGVITDIAETDKGHFYKLQDGDTEHIATTINKDFIKKLAGAHGLYVELSVHSQDLGKAKLIVDVLHVKEPEDLVPVLEASIAHVEAKKKATVTYDDAKGLAYGTVKLLHPPAGKGPMKVDVQCGPEALTFSTFSKSQQKRLDHSTGKEIELSYTVSEYKGRPQLDLKEVLRVGNVDFREDETTITKADKEPF